MLGGGTCSVMVASEQQRKSIPLQIEGRHNEGINFAVVLK